jgi:hypothetical protein
VVGVGVGGCVCVWGGDVGGVRGCRCNLERGGSGQERAGAQRQT